MIKPFGLTMPLTYINITATTIPSVGKSREEGQGRGRLSLIKDGTEFLIKQTLLRSVFVPLPPGGGNRSNRSTMWLCGQFTISGNDIARISQLFSLPLCQRNVSTDRPTLAVTREYICLIKVTHEWSQKMDQKKRAEAAFWSEIAYTVYRKLLKLILL